MNAARDPERPRYAETPYDCRPRSSDGTLSDGVYKNTTRKLRNTPLGVSYCAGFRGRRGTPSRGETLGKRNARSDRAGTRWATGAQSERIDAISSATKPGGHLRDNCEMTLNLARRSTKNEKLILYNAP